MKKFTSLFFVGLMMVPAIISAQSVAVNGTGNDADNSAILDVVSTAKGVLIPRMTAANRTGITSPATGLLVFQTDAPIGFYYNKGTPGSPEWTFLQPSDNVTTQGNTFNNANNLVRLDGTGRLPAVNGSQLTALPTNVTTQGNTFNTANNLVRLDGSSKLPAVDGSQLTNISAGSSILYSGYVTNSTSNSFVVPVLYTDIPLPKIAPYAYDPAKITFVSPVNGVIDNLQVKQVVTENSSGFVPANATVTLYKNNVATGLNCSFVTNATSATCNNLNAGNAVSINIGDTFYYHVTQSNSTSIHRVSVAVRLRN